MESKKGEYNTADPQVYVHLKDARKELLLKPTCAESILWYYLRNKKTGYKIRRQHVIDKYVVDFACLSKKLVIEIDGGIHLRQKEKDDSTRQQSPHRTSGPQLPFLARFLNGDSELLSQ